MSSHSAVSVTDLQTSQPQDSKQNCRKRFHHQGIKPNDNRNRQTEATGARFRGREWSKKELIVAVDQPASFVGVFFAARSHRPHPICRYQIQCVQLVATIRCSKAPPPLFFWWSGRGSRPGFSPSSDQPRPETASNFVHPTSKTEHIRRLADSAGNS